MNDHDDPRIKEARKLIAEVIKDRQQHITGLRPADPNLKQNYEALLAGFADVRGNKLYYPYIGSGIGRGVFVELLDGSVKYDFITGIGVHYLGHSHHFLVDAAVDAALSNTTMQGNLQQNADALEFSELLIKQSGLDHCFLTSSGAMANDNALKIAFQNKHPANRILAFERCFAGRTLACSQITDKAAFREGLPLNYFVDYVPFYDPEHPEESTKKTLNALKTLFSRYPKQHAVMIIELVQGEGGFYTATPEYFKAVMELLKQHEVLVFDDEVQTFGRTSRLFAFQHFGLESYVDIVTIGKLSQVCATLYRRSVSPKVGLLSQTFTSSTMAVQMGLRVLKELVNGNYFGPDGKILRIHSYFEQKLKQIQKRHGDLIHGPFGLGAMIAFTAFNGDNKKNVAFTHKLFENGVLSFVAGQNPTRIRFLIPMGVVKEHDIDEVCKIIEATLLEVGHA